MGDAAGMEGSSLAKIFVGGLDRSVDEGVVRNFFSQFGPVLEVSILRISVYLISEHSSYNCEGTGDEGSTQSPI